MVRFGLRYTALAVLGVLALSGCSAKVSSSAGAVPEGWTVVRGSALAAALDHVPERDGTVFFTDWSVQGRQNATAFARGLVSFDDQMQRDLGIRSTDARWELDVQRVRRPPVEVLGYDERTDLSGLAAKLTRLGYRADGPIRTGAMSREHMWTIPLRAIGIDSKRHLLIGSSDATAVRSLLTAPSRPLGHAASVVPLLTHLAAKHGRTATAAIAVGSAACVSLSNLLDRGGRATPEMLAAVRKRLPGTFTPPQAGITALIKATDVTAAEALTFPDHHTAQANQAGRSAAAQTLGGLAGNANQVRVTGGAVTGRVLSFDLIAEQPSALQQRLMAGTLGVDICP